MRCADDRSRHNARRDLPVRQSGSIRSRSWRGAARKTATCPADREMSDRTGGTPLPALAPHGPWDPPAHIVRGGQKCLVSHVWEVIGRRSDKSQGTQEGGAGAQALHGRSIARAFVRIFGSKKLAGKLRPFSTCLNAVLAASRRDQGLYGFPITCRCAQGVPANII